MRTYSLLFFIILLLVGCKKKTNQTMRQMPLQHIQVNKAEVTNLTCTYEYPAYLQSIQQVQLVARVAGYLQQIVYTPGIKVRKNDLLFVIEPQPYKDAVLAAQAAVDQAKAQFAYATANYQKMELAVQEQAVSEIDFLQAKSNYYSAEANLANAKSTLSRAEINLSYCYIKAPADGLVSVNNYDVGNYVGSPASPTSLATFYADSKMYAYFNMAYSDYFTITHYLKDINPAMISIVDPTVENTSWNGTLDYSSPNVEQTTGTVTLRAVVDNQDNQLLDGMYIKIIIPYKNVPNAVLLPESSIGTNQAGRYAFIVNRDSIVELRQLQVGFLNKDGMREIVTGVKPNETYVVKALISVRPGEKIAPYLER